MIVVSFFINSMGQGATAKIPVRKVGIKDLRYPIVMRDQRRQSQSTIAAVNMYVDLPHDFKGTHMSRFVEILSRYHGKISVDEMGNILDAMLDRFDSETAHIEVRFPYFIEKAAPVSGAEALMDYECGFFASADRSREPAQFDLVLEVRVPVTTLCPCSREISDNGAHNQRSRVMIRVRTCRLVWLEDLIEVAEQAASAPLYPLLKREDEKAVTEQAYDNPRFVEDCVRAVAVRLRDDPRITWYEVQCENLESIHNHNAYALVTGGEPRQ